MKWTNKGHEFDADYDRIIKLKKIYLFGAGHDGRMVADILKNRYIGLEIEGFIDNCEDMWGETVDGLKVFSPAEIEYQPGCGIVISFTSEYTREIDEQISKMGFKLSENFWHFEQFISVYALYRYNEVFFSSICILPTDACNLKCKVCLNFTNYIRHFKNQPIEKLKDELDTYFKNIDYTGLFFISGGEPLMYKQLPELVAYIDEKYSGKIYEFGIVTNGTLAPSRELQEVLKKSSIRITVDDYRDAIPDMSEGITNNIEIYKALGKDNLLIRKYDEWISLYPHEIDDLEDEELIKKYNSCHCPWQEYKDGRLFSCDYASFATNAGLVDSDIENDTYFLSSQTDKRELMEFRLGYTKKGYVEFCRKCAGYMDINPYKIKAAEQG